MTQEQANWVWMDGRVSKLEARIKDLETALAFYKSSLETVEQAGGPCIPMCPPSVCDCMGTRK